MQADTVPRNLEPRRSTLPGLSIDAATCSGAEAQQRVLYNRQQRLRRRQQQVLADAERGTGYTTLKVWVVHSFAFS